MDKSDFKVESIWMLSIQQIWCISDEVVKILFSISLDLFRCRLTCGASIGKQSWNDSKYCECRSTTEIIRKKAVVYICFVNLMKNVHAEEQILKCQNLQWFASSMDAAYFRTQSTRHGLSSPVGLSCRTWNISLILVFYAAAFLFCFVFSLGPSFLWQHQYFGWHFLIFAKL